MSNQSSARSISLRFIVSHSPVAVGEALYIFMVDETADAVPERRRPATRPFRRG